MGLASHTRRSRLWLAVPNSLSLVRVVLGVAFPWLSPWWRVAAVLAAAVSDMLDGATSRLLRASSHTGRMLDPLADKAFALAVVVTLLVEGSLGLGEAVLIGLRDTAVFVGVMWLLVRCDWSGLRRLPPTWLGKTTTFAQFVYLLALLWDARHWSLLTVTGVLSGLAAVQYSWLFVTRRRRAGKLPAAP